MWILRRNGKYLLLIQHWKTSKNDLLSRQLRLSKCTSMARALKKLPKIWEFHATPFINTSAASKFVLSTRSAICARKWTYRLMPIKNYRRIICCGTFFSGLTTVNNIFQFYFQLCSNFGVFLNDIILL